MREKYYLWMYSFISKKGRIKSGWIRTNFDIRQGDTDERCNRVIHEIMGKKAHLVYRYLFRPLDPYNLVKFLETGDG